MTTLDEHLSPKEQRNLDLLMTKPLWVSRVETARRLVEMSSGYLRIAPLKSYVALQPADGTKPSVRNAIAILEEGISFTVSDWSDEDEAKGYDLAVQQGEKTKFKTIKRLRFPELDRNSVDAHSPFFSKLVTNATKIIFEKKH